MIKYLFWSAAAMVMIAKYADSERILALFPFPGRSHLISFSPLLEELANRGHQVTVVTAFPRKSPLKNYKEIVYENYLALMGEKDTNMFKITDMNVFLEMIWVRSMTIQWCDTFLSDQEVQNLIHSTDEHYDLIIYEPFFSECAYGLVYKFKVPFMHISSNTINQWMGDGVGNPYFYSYIPDVHFGYSDHMTFKERMVNGLFQMLMELERNWITLPKMEAVMQKHFNDPTIPSILEIETNSSFLLLNSHISLNYPRPLTPNTVEVGGMHLQEPKKLPEDLQKLLDAATDGVIYFSLGSHIKSVHMPETMRNDILKSFSKLKQKILWKWEADTLPEQPKNVHISKWFPQNDILAHPNVKAFITHGGLLSAQEATYLGIPLITIPFGADQRQNAKRAESQGYAIVLNTKNITEKTFDWALNEILTNKNYRQNVKRLSNIFRDQPQRPLDVAVFWTEYVIRHKGALHMRSAALKLNFFQYYSLDLIAVILSIVIIMIKLSLIVVKLLFRRLFSKSIHTKHKKAD